MERDVVTELADRLDELLRREATTDKLVETLEGWATTLADHHGQPVPWDLIDPLWRDTHDLLTEFKRQT